MKVSLKINVCGSDERQKVRRKLNTKLQPKKMKGTVQQGVSFIVWGCMAASGVGNLDIINCIMN